MASLKVPFEAGMAVRKTMKNTISRICDIYNMDRWEVDE